MDRGEGRGDQRRMRRETPVNPGNDDRGNFGHGIAHTAPSRLRSRGEARSELADQESSPAGALKAQQPGVSVEGGSQARTARRPLIGDDVTAHPAPRRRFH